jgi:hypothetical protein
MQHDVVNFATALLQIKAQIICQHFTEDTIVKISGAMQLSPQDQALIPQALALLKDEPAKNFRIEVTSDSMIYQDEQQEKQDRVEFLSAVSQFMQTALPVANQSPELTPLLMEMLKFGVTAFKAGKGMEGLIDETADKFRQEAKAQEGQPKPPTPEMQKLQMQIQADQQKLQAQTQMEVQKFQAQNELEKAKQEYQAQENQLKFSLEEQRNTKQAELDNTKAVLLAYLDNAAKLETARINAGLTDGSMAYMESVDQAKIIQDSMGFSQMANHPLQPAMENMQNTNAQLTQMVAALMQKLSQPKQIIRDENGKIIGVQ